MNNKLRIKNHPILEFKRGKRITFQFESKPVEAYETESIAAALFASGVKVLSRSKRFGNPKGWFCGIGKCCSCLMRVDGIPNVRTCVVPVREGMQVERQEQAGMVPAHSDIHVEREEMNVQVLIVGAIKEGYTTPVDIKNHLRPGMGSCQGRGCATQIMRLIRQITGQSPESIVPLSTRPPIVPVPIGVLGRIKRQRVKRR